MGMHGLTYSFKYRDGTKEKGMKNILVGFDHHNLFSSYHRSTGENTVQNTFTAIY